jgi:glutamine phosphoribosylpyrophosphate amidotransferase
MCAILGTFDYNRYQYLYKENLSRGDFAYGEIYLNKDHYLLTKKPGIKDFSEVDERSAKVFDYFLCHVQAPTSSVREFHIETSHPFQLGSFLVSHNGVLTNDKLLKSQTKEYYNEVDSSVIPALLIEEVKLCGLKPVNKREIISSVLSRLEGTYSLWIYNSWSHNVYIARSGSTLFMNRKTREFSSIKLPDIEEEVPEGKLFEITDKEIVEVGEFKANSPFFVI